MIDVTVALEMSRMTDNEWTNWYIGRARMLAYRHAREFLADMGLGIDDPRYSGKELALFEQRLGELWDEYSLPADLWPDKEDPVISEEDREKSLAFLSQRNGR